jgi:drug/metabolite transporter (DMT)-like permease
VADTHPHRTGTLFALAGGAAFGVSTPLTQRYGAGLGPFTVGGLLYLGAALLSAARLTPPGENRVRRVHLPRVTAAALAGAFFAPVCLAFGLSKATGTGAALMLNLEVVFTVLLAAVFLREELGARLLVGVAAMLGGSAVLVFGAATAGASTTLGLVAIALATFGWAVDNVTLRALAELDPRHVVLWKAAIGSLLSFAVALVLREPLPAVRATLLLLACGTIGYGLSLRFYLLALRRIGSARTAAMFSSAPFAGALAAWLLGQGDLGLGTLVAGLFFGLGAYLQAGEKHGHIHTHVAVDHEHSHRHDDGHHDHIHDPPVSGEHSHRHRHEATTHDHEHATDAHHAHRH